MNIKRISQMEHDLGLKMPCSDEECIRCFPNRPITEIYYNHNTFSYDVITRKGNQVVRTVISAQLMELGE